MPTWSDLLDELDRQPNDKKSAWLNARLDEQLVKISQRRGQNVIVYASGFLQKPSVPSFATSINREDINGLMCAAHGLDFTKGLSLVIHTPGGEIASTETMVDYLRSKFKYIEAIVPVYAMSGGTMIALNSNKIVMGRQSQLGPIDAQLQVPGGYVSASSILDQFNTAKKEIDEDREAAVVWAPILQAMGPSLLSQAQRALDLGQQIAEFGLQNYMFEGKPGSDRQAREVAAYFNSEDVHLNHGRRIGVEECAGQGLTVERLEDDQEFQDEVLTAYHLLTIVFEQSAAVKIVRNHEGQGWVKHFHVKR